MSKKDDFLRIAHSWMGRTADCKAWIRTTVGYNTNQAWCAAFVMSCAKSAGIFGKVMNGGFCVQTWFITGVSQKLGTFHKAGWHGIQYKPAPGDLICFRWNRHIPKNRNKVYFGNHIGIVGEVDSNGYVTTYEGNHGGKAATRRYNWKTEKNVNGYFHPNWSKLGIADDDPVDISGGGAYEPLYTDYSTDEDANMREVMNIKEDGTITSQPTGIALSVINYTTGLAALVDYFGVESVSNEYEVDVSNIQDKNAKIIAQYLFKKGLNASNVVGILACIQTSCKFDIALADHTGSSLGMLQWSGDRRKQLMKKVPNWSANLSGQLDFMWGELSSTKKRVLEDLYKVVNISYNDAFACAKLFHTDYQGYTLTDKTSNQLLNAVVFLWKQLILIPTEVSGTTAINNGNITTRSGKTLTKAVKKIIVPDDVKQRKGGMDPTYESYGWIYNVQKKSNNRGKQIGNEWVKQGCPKHRGIATVSGYYLVGVTTHFGRMGDILTIVLKDGTSLNVIVGDSKGAHRKWGSTFKDGVNIVEWNKWAPPTEPGIKNNRKLDLTGWQGKQIDYMLNWGTYLQ